MVRLGWIRSPQSIEIRYGTSQAGAVDAALYTTASVDTEPPLQEPTCPTPRRSPPKTPNAATSAFNYLRAVQADDIDAAREFASHRTGGCPSCSSTPRRGSSPISRALWRHHPRRLPARSRSP
ncbi:hypothetical protein ACWC4C_33400 [Streptomyces olivaceoviridis]